MIASPAERGKLEAGVAAHRGGSAAEAERLYREVLAAEPGNADALHSGGDRYTGLDRFGRVVYQNWFNTSTGAQTQGDQYGYDNDSDVLFDSVVGQGSTAAKYSQLYHASSTASGDNNSGYDLLGRETAFIQGTLSASGNNTNSDAPLDTVTNASINTGSGSDQTFTMDALGNRTNFLTGAGTGTATAPSFTATANTMNSQNEITESIGGACCTCWCATYDNDGNMTADGMGNTYTYDAWGDMIYGGSSGSNPGSASFAFDANGRQAVEDYTNSACTTSCGTTDSTSVSRDANEYYSGQGQVVEDYGYYVTSNCCYTCCACYCYFCSCGYTTDTYSWGMDYVNDLVLRDSSATIGTWSDVNGTITTTSGTLTPQRIYAEHDANYDVKTLTNASGTVLEHIVYDPYGNATLLNSSYASTGTAFGSDSYNWIYGFQGGRYDPGSGLYHFGARNDNPVTGRWMEQDPAGYVDGADLYQVDAGSPAGLADPTGLAATATNPFGYAQPTPPRTPFTRLGDTDEYDPSNPDRFSTAPGNPAIFGTPPGVAPIFGDSTESFDDGLRIDLWDNSVLDGDHHSAIFTADYTITINHSNGDLSISGESATDAKVASSDGQPNSDGVRIADYILPQVQPHKVLVEFKGSGSDEETSAGAVATGAAAGIATGVLGALSWSGGFAAITPIGWGAIGALGVWGGV